jgi:hypothetical protein
MVCDKGLTTRKIITALLLATETRDVGTPVERKCGNNGGNTVRLYNKIMLTEDVLYSTMNRIAVKRVYRRCVKNTEIVITALW